MSKEEVEAAITALEATIWQIDSWVLLFAIILFVGLAGETVLGVAHWLKDRQLKPLRVTQAQIHENELAQLNNETARLRAKEPLVDDALLANAQAARANTQAARANALAGLMTRTVAEHIALAQGLVTPERTSEAARSLLIIEKVKLFAGKQVDAVVTSSDLELEALLGLLRAALKAAGWIEVDRSDDGVIIHREQSSFGRAGLIKIHVDASKISELWEAAEALASALNTEGIEALAIPTSPPDASNANAIHIEVSAKAQ